MLITHLSGGCIGTERRDVVRVSVFIIGTFLGSAVPSGTCSAVLLVFSSSVSPMHWGYLPYHCLQTLTQSECALFPAVMWRGISVKRLSFYVYTFTVMSLFGIMVWVASVKQNNYLISDLGLG